jgi:hypothetical protein
MSNTITEIALVIGAYLIGSFPYMLILSRARGVIINPEEDYHLAVWQKVGRLEGVSGVAVDVIKGMIPIVFGFLLDLRLAIIVCAGVATVIGQMWPIFQRFNGGKGNTTGAGMALVLTIFLWNHALLVLYCCLFCFLAGFLVRTIPRLTKGGKTIDEKLKLGGPTSNSMPLGMFAGFAILPIASGLLNQPMEMTLAFALMFVAIATRRLTANLGKDLVEPKTSVGRILVNRFLFDRSYY